jgi:hypothetical protein
MPSDDLELEERRLRMELMRADIDLKREQTRWEPWKALATAFGAGLAFASAFLALAAWILSHWIS